MIDKTKLEEFIEGQLSDTDCFLTSLKVSSANEVTVEIDSDTAVDLDFCIELNRAIEEAFPSDDEDYELEVGSAGITSPLKLPRQYRKYVGKELDLYHTNGKKLLGTLLSCDDEGIILQITRKEKIAGEKRPVTVTEDLRIFYPEIRKASYHLEF